MDAELPLVSVIVPCRNEQGWIRACLESILGNDYPKERLEVLIVDGMSDDSTRDIVAEFAAREPLVRLVDNPKRITPAALNLGILAGRGAVVLRMDAHVEYPVNYISSLVESLGTSGADNVGGVCQTRPANETAMARAIAVGLSHPLGVGNSHFRIGAKEPRWVDTVPFGCYRREVFERIGLFDEELVRNQDDELNLRLIRRGGRILLLPQIVCQYYARDSLRKLWRMYYQYGYFKPLVVRKVKAVMTVRQLVPPAFVLVLLAGGLLAPWSRLAAAGLALVVVLYLSVIAISAVRVATRHGLRAALAMFLVFPAMHLSYGLGYLRGLGVFVFRRRIAAVDQKSIPISR
jgi:glycosyltransferase involved in cell wall biosynthesis